MGKKRGVDLDSRKLGICARAFQRLRAKPWQMNNSVPQPCLIELRNLLGCDTDLELAWIFGTSPQNISNRRNRNAVPYKEAIYLALWAGLSLDYLLAGRGTLRFRPVSERSDYGLLRALLILATRERKGRPPRLTLPLAEKVAKAFERADQMVARLTEKHRSVAMDEDDIRAKAFAATDLFDEDG